MYIIHVLEKKCSSIYTADIRKATVRPIFRIQISSAAAHLQAEQASMAVTVSRSPAHLLAPASHSLIVTATATAPSPAMTHSGAESLGQSDTSRQIHFPVDSVIEIMWNYI